MSFPVRIKNINSLTRLPIRLKALNNLKEQLNFIIKSRKYSTSRPKLDTFNDFDLSLE